MATQPSLFDDLPAANGASPVVLPGSKQALSKEQRRFNKLIADIETARMDLARWSAFIPRAMAEHAARTEPLRLRYRELRVEIARALDAAAGSKRLNKSQRRKVVDLLTSQLTDLMEEERTPELDQLFEKHGLGDFDEEHEAGLALMRELMRETTGVEVDQDARSPEDFAHAIRDKLAEENEALAREQQRSRRKAGAKAAARAAAEKVATQSVREVYRKLASELHPDREPDPAKRARKTDLMQHANTAYQAGDLLALLELQLKIEQIDPAHLSGLPNERLVHYNHVLAGQLQSIKRELADLLTPIAGFMGYGRAQLAEDDLRRTLDQEYGELRKLVRATEADVASFRDIDVLKRRLRTYKVGDALDQHMAEIESMLLGGGAHIRGWARR